MSWRDGGGVAAAVGLLSYPLRNGKTLGGVTAGSNTRHTGSNVFRYEKDREQDYMLQRT